MQDAATCSSGYASTRNDKLRLLARQKRASSSSSGGGGGQAEAGAAAGGSSGGGARAAAAGHKTVRLSSVLQQAPQHFDSTKVCCVPAIDGFWLPARPACCCSTEQGTVRLC
jgi:hypothetical protein